MDDKRGGKVMVNYCRGRKVVRGIVEPGVVGPDGRDRMG